MSDRPVVFHDVWKKFRRGERYDSLRDIIPATVRRALGRSSTSDLSSDSEFWALEDVSFELEPGQALGIIGPNGAGKSTTLKLLTKLLRPTRGYCAVTGRVGALIEVAAGFHPDLTGRENVYLQGAIMGMKRADIARRFDDIVAFAGVESFVDTQVKRYSSGMNARLGFAIAAHLEPDVLIIDEVLSVGDMGFQQRCTERMREFRAAGVTIVFVSHNLQAVSQLCDQALLLHRRVMQLGPTNDVIAAYVRASDAATQPARAEGFEVTGAKLFDLAGAPVAALEAGERGRLAVRYQLGPSIADVELGIVLYRSTDGLEVYHANFTPRELGLTPADAGREIEVDYTFAANVTRGQYHFAAHVFHIPTHEYLARASPAAILTVGEQRTRAGVASLDVTASLRPHIATARSEFATAARSGTAHAAGDDRIVIGPSEPSVGLAL
jgi:lipopolysaccharide transport system ATP-binding protein